MSHSPTAVDRETGPTVSDTNETQDRFVTSDECSKAHVGDRFMVFDALSWSPLGDQGDNSHFWKPATIERIYHNGWDRLADVKWDDGTFTNGHFISAMKPL